MHIIITGQSGKGKSNSVKYLVSSVVRNTATKFWINDLSDEYSLLKSIIPDLLVVRAGEFFDNPFERPTPDISHEDWLGIISQVFEAELGFMLAAKMRLVKTLRWLFKHRGVFDGSENYPTCRDVFNCLSKAKDSAKTFSERDGLDVLVRRMEHLSSFGSCFSSPRSIPITELTNRHVLFDFSSCSDEIYALLICSLLTKAYVYRMYHQDESHSRLLTVLEEARTLLDTRRAQRIDYPEPTINRLMAQFRKYKGGFVAVAQEPSTICTTAKANAYTTLAFPIAEGNELISVANSMRLTKQQAKYMLKLPIGTGVVRHGTHDPFLVTMPKINFPPLPMSSEQIQAETDAFLAPYRTINEQALRAIQVNRKKEQSSSEQAPPDPAKVVYALGESPFLNFTELMRRCGFGAERLRKARSWLELRGFAIAHSIKVSKAKAASFLELTGEAYEGFGLKPPKGKGGFKSKLFAQIIKQAMESQGCQARIEGNVGGKLVDVLVHDPKQGLVAYEITNSFSNVKENIEKDLATGEVAKVVIVLENGNRLQKLKQKLAEELSPGMMDSVEFKTMQAFFQNKGGRNGA